MCIDSSVLAAAKTLQAVEREEGCNKGGRTQALSKLRTHEKTKQDRIWRPGGATLRSAVRVSVGEMG
jgi:hypothetical protein